MRQKLLILIAAHDRNGAIGRNGGLPWTLPEDLACFRRETTGHTVYMGRKTWDSIGRPLPRRRNVVITRTPGTMCQGAEEMTLDAAIDAIRRADGERHYCIGGGEIYAAMLPFADRLLFTRVDTEVAGADTFLPVIERGEWAELRQVLIREAEPACYLHEYHRLSQNTE